MPSSGMKSSSPAAASGTTLKTMTTSDGTVLTDSAGYTVYWFAKDHGMTSACTGACATAWPPVTGMPAAAMGVSLPGKLGTISRGNGVVQATYDGHPLYTFAGDTTPGESKGNDIDGFGGLWWAMTSTGSMLAKSATSTASPSSTSSSSSSSGSGW
jgi:predicted lipoprotein with Yx(FWY)xxD motif